MSYYDAMRMKLPPRPPIGDDDTMELDGLLSEEAVTEQAIFEAVDRALREGGYERR